MKEADEAVAAGVDPRRLLQELQVHQIELEMQNAELRQAQLDLEEARDRYLDLYEFAPVAYLTLAAGGTIAEINLTGATLLGEERGRLLKHRFADFVAAEDNDRWHRFFSDALQREDRQHCELAMQRGDGSPFHARLNCLHAAKAGEAPRLRIALSDITEQHQAEAELRQAKDAAEEASRTKSIFVATMSHEIRTPLGAIVGLTGLLADSPLTRRQRDYADKIQLSAQALRALLDDILDFSKIEAGALRLELAPFSLNTLLRTTGAVVSMGIRGKPIEAFFDVGPDVPDALMGDALRLQQILLNLTNNAVKFTEAGLIVFSVRCLARDAGQVTLEFAVRDTGPGIPPDQLERIFEVFTQAEASTSRVYGGSGLGLAISARLAKLLGSQIDVTSTPGQGSEFCFSVTLALADNALPISPAANQAGLRILIVDDQALSRELLTRGCAGFHWQATAVDSGAAALAELRRGGDETCNYDLLLLDWHMPAMNGLEMLRQAQATDIRLPLVVLMTSTFELEQAVAASDDLCLDGIAAKPLTPASLFEAVTRAYFGEPSEPPLSAGRPNRRLAGMRLLVAEDNALNQQVIERILTRAGAEVVIAANGRLAVEALQVPGADFDAVLMDIQMPVMDGYAATRVIREELGLLDLPIVALTAYAQSEDREKSRRAGMVGHIVKPMDIEALFELVRPDRRSSKGQYAVERRQRAAAALPLPLPGLDIAAALTVFGGDDKKLGELLHQFLVRHGGDVKDARQLFNAGDSAAATRLVHDLCGVAGLLQAPALARLAATTEEALRENHAKLLPPLFDELQLAMDTLGASIDQLGAALSIGI